MGEISRLYLYSRWEDTVFWKISEFGGASGISVWVLNREYQARGDMLLMVIRVIGYSHLKYEASYHPSIIFSQIYGLLFFSSVRVIVLLIEYFPYDQKFWDDRIIFLDRTLQMLCALFPLDFSIFFLHFCSVSRHLTHLDLNPILFDVQQVKFHC